MQALGDPTRRAVFEQLRSGPRSVGELARGLPVSRPAVSQHLRVLKGAGLVTDEQQGTRRLYRIEPDGLEQLRAWFDSFWNTALADRLHLASRPRRWCAEDGGRGPLPGTRRLDGRRAGAHRLGAARRGLGGDALAVRERLAGRARPLRAGDLGVRGPGRRNGRR